MRGYRSRARRNGLRWCISPHVRMRSAFRWFRVTERNDLDAARDYMPRALADSLPRLPDYVCIETSDAGAAFREESAVGKIKVFGAPPHVRKRNYSLPR